MFEPVASADPRLRADPLADDTIARVLGTWDDGTPAMSRWDAIALVNRELAGWQTNGMLDGWKASLGTPAPIAAALEDYVARARRLPDWVDAGKVGCAEAVFVDMSMLSCTLLFCASLPECYVPADLASVLHTAGQLEQHTDYRVRSTAAMIFPVMLRGGLLDPAGGGVAQVLKVRLIHATIRHLIVRGNPGEALEHGAVIAPLLAEGRGLHQTLFARGWDVNANGLPVNQEELAYTLLTFHYVFLRGLRRLGLGLSKEEEGAYLHAWNVVGHLLGIEQELLVETMGEAEALFARLQQDGRALAAARYAPSTRKVGATLYARSTDPRPALAHALMRAMQDEIPLRALKAFPVLLTRRLCGKDTGRDLGLDGRVSLFSRAVFALGMGVTRTVDTLVRLVCPGFSISRLVTRIFGYRLTTRFLMDQTRPLKLPEALLHQVDGAVRGWDLDPQAPGWMNAIEQRLRPATPAPEPTVIKEAA
ncbi:oxygenase MpaB family protein [Massilia suwonensis]|uniref:Oxygenase MpaB family protein n=1 Tax=Massilia suwonensis TaxID=648895 RepID=A0ABW0MIS4_9BURK